MCVCHVAADELGAIFLFIVNKQSCPPPFVSRDRETLKSGNPSALNLSNDGGRGAGAKKNENILRRTRVLRANPLLCIDNVCDHAYARAGICERVCALFARSLLAGFLVRSYACAYANAYVYAHCTVFVDGHSSVHRMSVSSVLTIADSLTNPRSIFLFSGNSIPQPIAITRGIGYIDGIVVNAKLNPTDKSKAPLLLSLCDLLAAMPNAYNVK